MRQFAWLSSLRAKLILSTVLVEALTLGLIVWNSQQVAEEHLRRQFEQRRHEAVVLLQAALAAPMAQHDLAGVSEIMEAVQSGQGYEYLAMLDPRGREQVMLTIHHLNKNMGITVVSITHYMEEAAQADRVLVMSKGNVVMEGTPKEVFSQTEKVRALRLDVPQAAELRDELVKAGIPMPEGIIDTGACAQALYELLK